MESFQFQKKDKGLETEDYETIELVDFAKVAIFLKSGRGVGSYSKHEFINSATFELTKLGTVGTNLPADTVEN